MMKKLFLGFLLMFNLVQAQTIQYTSGNDSWDADNFGNHRAVVVCNTNVSNARVKIEWRRRDEHPENIKLIVADAVSGTVIQNIKPVNINREFGDFIFQTVTGSSKYYVYYLPYEMKGRSNYPAGKYQKPIYNASDEWLKTIDVSTLQYNATCNEIQSIDTFNSFYPMEIIATKAETEKLISDSKQKDFVVFPEDREHPVKMENDLPQRWIKPLSATFKGTSDKGEFYAFQLAVYALKDIENVTVEFSDLVSGKSIIKNSAISCININGVSYNGENFTKAVEVKKGKIQPLWCGINVAKAVPSGIYKGTATIHVNGCTDKIIHLNITVTDGVAKNGNVDKPWLQTRLNWLNSTIAQENTVIAPYTPLTVKGNSINLLGRKLLLNDDGLPKQIQTFFTDEMTSVSSQPKDIIQQPIHFVIKNTNGEKVQAKKTGLKFISKEEGTVQWTSTLQYGDLLKMQVDGSLEFDGFVSYKVKIEALQNCSLQDIALEIPYTNDAAEYMMGLGLKGGYRPENYQWEWDVEHKSQEGAWIGSVNAGMQFTLRDDKYYRPLNTNFYLQNPLHLPGSWGNENKGGIDIRQLSNKVLVTAYSGARTMKKNEVQYYYFNLIITPFHTLNTNFQWATRFYHKYDDLDSIKSKGATVVNIHHATPINPWINYPFIEYKKMKEYIDKAHSMGLKVKIYNTIREISNRVYEMYALRSLGYEVLLDGKGGGFSWLKEHLDSNYSAAWFVPEIKDAAVLDNGMSRWNNYYVEGMNWLTQNVGIDGIYLDDVAFDRNTMKRIKRVLTEDGHPGIIDLHSANQYNKNDGFNNSANLYLEHFPYLNRLWFGEYFDYENNTPDFFLTEISGIPFGLMGEMLQNGGNPWRGLIYGMTNRMPWSDNADPRPIWKLWDDFGMEDCKMIGYWSKNCPVKTNNNKVIATVYKKNNAALVCIASWADGDMDVQLNIDWEKLGLNRENIKLEMPAIKGMQEYSPVTENQTFHIQKGKGVVLTVKSK